MAKITTPVAGYTGVKASVIFANGIGETDNPALITWFKNHGYTVKEEEKKLEDMTVEELTAYAAKNNVDIGKATTKATILEKINAANTDNEGATK